MPKSAPTTLVAAGKAAVPIRRLKPLLEAVKIPSGKMIVLASPAELAPEGQILSSKLRQLSTSEVQVPEHLQDLFQTALNCCEIPQDRTSLHQLLVYYADVFRRDASDIGTTDMVKHAIPIQTNTAPIKQ